MLVTICVYTWMYRGVLLDDKILFPSNFLAQFYSPWVTTKFTGWDAGIPHKPIGTDQIRFFYPALTFTTKALAKHDFPLWNPYIFAGNAHAADVQSAVWYPLNLLYFFVSQLTAWQLLVVLQSILSFWFMYLYVRLLTANPLASWVSAIAFGLSGFYVAWSSENMSVGHAGLWLPLVLLSIENFYRSRLFRYIVIGALALTASLLAGFFQVTVYLYMLVAIYVLGKYLQAKKVSRSTLGILVFMMIIPIGLSAIAFVPSLEAYTLSPRSTSNVSYLFHTYLLPITHLVQSLSPDIFGSPGSYNYFGRGFYHETVLFIGLVPMLFALFAIHKYRANWYAKFFLWVSVGSYFLTLDNPITRGIFQLPIPLFSTFLPSRILYIATFSLSVLAGLGFDAWQKDKKVYPAWIVGSVAGLLALSVGYGVAIMKLSDNAVLHAINIYTLQQAAIESRHGVVMLRNALLSLGILFGFFVFTRRVVPKGIATISIIVIILVSQFYTLQKYTVLGEREFLYPSHPVIEYLHDKQDTSRFVSFGSRMLGNISTQFALFSPEGLDPMYIRRYGELVYAAMHNGKFEKNIPRIEVEFSSMNDAEHMSDNAFRLRLMNLLGVKNVAYFENEPREKIMRLAERFPKEIFIPRWQNGNWHIFENANVLPRVMLLHEYVIEQNPQKILDKLFDPKLNLGNTVVLEEEPIGFHRGTAKVSSVPTVAIKQYGASRVEVVTDSVQDEILFLSDSYHPGWHVYVDGRKVKLLRANYAFRAVVVPRGAHKVVFEYKPASLSLGYAITKGSIAVLILVWVAYALWYNNERKRNLK